MKKVILFFSLVIVLLISCSVKKDNVTQSQQLEEIPVNKDKAILNDLYDGKIFFRIDDVNLSVLEKGYEYYKEQEYDKETLEALLIAGVKGGLAVYSDGDFYIEFKKNPTIQERLDSINNN